MYRPCGYRQTRAAARPTASGRVTRGEALQRAVAVKQRQPLLKGRPDRLAKIEIVGPDADHEYF